MNIKEILSGVDDQNILKLITESQSYTLLYFYPKDDSPGCTAEACSMRDNLNRFKINNATVIGVSRDTEESHTVFKKKYDLNFKLIADTTADIHKAFNIINDGKAMRASFLIDSKGEVIKSWLNVNPETHADEVNKFLEDIKANSAKS